MSNPNGAGMALLFLLIAGSLGAFAWRFLPILKTIRGAKADPRFSLHPLGPRVWDFFWEVICQAKVIKERPLPGLAHAFLFWAFCAFALVTLDHIGRGFGFHLLDPEGWFGGLYFGLAMLFAAVLFVGMATGLTLWLGQSERAKTHAVLLSLGASQTAIRSFSWGEGLVMLGMGLCLGAPIGATVAWMLVRLLGGAFDPPPEILSIPWSYLALVLAGAIGSTVGAVFAQGVWSKEWAVRELRAGR